MRDLILLQEIWKVNVVFKLKKKEEIYREVQAALTLLCLDFYTNTRKQAGYFKKHRCHIKSAYGTWDLGGHI